MPLAYLCNLDSSQLPLVTEDPVEIKKISKLAAVGLLCAEIRPNFMQVRILEPASATVLSITPAGLEKIAKLKLGFPDTVPASLP